MCGFGVFTWTDGRQYTGNFLNDKKEGKGELVWPDGKKYDGDWKNGRQHGEGYETCASDGIRRRGKWQEGNLICWFESEQSNSRIISGKARGREVTPN